MPNKPTQTAAWQKLDQLNKHLSKTRTVDLFNQDDDRVNRFTRQENDFLYDFSKQKIDEDTFNSLLDLCKESNLEQRRAEMFSGEKINNTEGRAVLHTALRRPATDTVLVDGENVMPVIHNTLSKMKKISDDLHAGALKGATGKVIDTVISIGIGGSDLGPRMIYNALEGFVKTPITTHFVSNIDADDILSALKKCNPETTLILTISKSFKTQETLTNSLTAREWLKNNLPEDVDISSHLYAVSTNIEACTEFGIAPNNIFPMWDWVNGRFSLWSAVGLSLSMHFGFDTFRKLLDGAHDADQHFTNTDLNNNLPVIMGVLGLWNRNFLEHACHALLPYTEKLALMPAYIQQLEMESNGKNIDYGGDPIHDYKTCPTIFGEVGTNGQHSFYQLLHQGSDKIPCDFIGIIKPDHDKENHQTFLLSHMLAQGQAMLQGRLDPDESFRYFAGDIPSSTFLVKEMNAYNLGFLTALYEHKTFVQGVLWNLNSFDQYGVELGKELSKKLEENDLSNADPSTLALHSYIHKMSKEG